MFPSQPPDLLHLLRTIAHIIAVDYNVICFDPVLDGLLIVRKVFKTTSNDFLVAFYY